ncbi:hypothetical protein [Tunturiibacter gelidiferens]|uniref:hypothetical protein n=1 Tax=Tunturiibacter gelidiferens TaxID=3069689 RepID=UPI003D9B2524
MTKAKTAKVLEFPTTTIEDNYPPTKESDVVPCFDFLRRMKVPKSAIEMLDIYAAITGKAQMRRSTG